jgi:hypothetical protein
MKIRKKKRRLGRVDEERVKDWFRKGRLRAQGSESVEQGGEEEGWRKMLATYCTRVLHYRVFFSSLKSDYAVLLQRNF